MIIRKYRWSMSQPGNGMIEDDEVKDGWYRSPEVEAALAEKEEKIQAAMEAGKMLKEQRDKAEKQITALTDELGTVKEILRQLNNRDKRLQDEALRGEEVGDGPNKIS